YESESDHGQDRERRDAHSHAGAQPQPQGGRDGTPGAHPPGKANGAEADGNPPAPPSPPPPAPKPAQSAFFDISLQPTTILLDQKRQAVNTSWSGMWIFAQDLGSSKSSEPWSLASQATHQSSSFVATGASGS
ncbi:unnamed protein product, partial [Amoebophrya sp. A25]